MMGSQVCAILGFVCHECLSLTFEHPGLAIIGMGLEF